MTLRDTTPSDSLAARPIIPQMARANDTLRAVSPVRVALTRGYSAVIDAGDAPRVLAYRWHASVRRGGKYVYAASGPAGLLHRFVLDAPAGMQVDHVNGDTLDCRRENLRLCTHTQNLQNQRVSSDNRCGFKGVHQDPRSGSWYAQIKVRCRRIHLGTFGTAEEAARAYDAAALLHFGAFARLNFAGSSS